MNNLETKAINTDDELQDAVARENSLSFETVCVDEPSQVIKQPQLIKHTKQPSKKSVCCSCCCSQNTKQPSKKSVCCCSCCCSQNTNHNSNNCCDDIFWSWYWYSYFSNTNTTTNCSENISDCCKSLCDCVSSILCECDCDLDD